MLLLQYIVQLKDIVPTAVHMCSETSLPGVDVDDPFKPSSQDSM